MIICSKDVFGFDTKLNSISSTNRPLLVERAARVEREFVVDLGFEPMKADNVELLQTPSSEDTRVTPAGKSMKGRRMLSTQFSAADRKTFERDGFVVHRSSGLTFPRLYSQIYSDELPLFVSCDCVLQAFHQSFDNALADIETGQLWSALATMIDKMREALPQMYERAGKLAKVAQALLDADAFLAVARCVLRDVDAQGLTSADRSELASYEENLAYYKKHKLKNDLQKPEVAKSPLLVLKHKDTTAAESSVQQWVTAATQASGTSDIVLFGQLAKVDFSLFKPRGHYTKNDTLKSYFRAMSWLNNISIRLDMDRKEAPDQPRSVVSACTMAQLLKAASGAWDIWQRFETLLGSLVGASDNATFADVKLLLDSVDAELIGDCSLLTDGAVTKLIATINKGDIGSQAYSGRAYAVPEDASAPVVLPRIFALMGGKFVLDGWVHAQVTYDRIRAIRRLPSGVDVAYAVFANDACAPTLVDRMRRKASHPHFINFRDGIDFAQALDNVRTCIDVLPQTAWQTTIYMRWLAMLRALSSQSTTVTSDVDTKSKKKTSTVSTSTASTSSTVGAGDDGDFKDVSDSATGTKSASTWYDEVVAWLDDVAKCGIERALPPMPSVVLPRGPRVMRTRAYALKNLRTQLASWATLRHDTILYAKQPFCGSCTACDTPSAYVEPQLAFWLHTLALYQALARTFKQHNCREYYAFERAVPTLTRVARICAKQLAHVPLSVPAGKHEHDNHRPYTDMSDVSFLKRTVERVYPGGSGATPYWGGWYMTLFYGDQDDIVDKSDALVADVFTASKDDEVRDPGAILHAATSDAHLMTIAVDVDDGKQAAFVGPVFAFSEFKMPPNERLSDEEWRAQGMRSGLKQQQLLDLDIQQ